MHKRSCFWKPFRSERVNQFAIFKQLSCCFEETIGFDVKASFASRPVLHLISWYNNQVIQQNNFDKKLFSSTGLFIDWKLQTVMALFFFFFFSGWVFSLSWFERIFSFSSLSLYFIKLSNKRFITVSLFVDEIPVLWCFRQNSKDLL